MKKTLNEMKNACAYIRVSTDKQEELSPDAQKRLLLDYAKNNHIMILPEHIFIENGISGKKADKRPQFMQMVGMAKSKEHPFDVILVWKFSRFARNQEESIVYKSLLKKCGVEVVSVSEPLVDGPFGSLIERIIEWMDEYYSIRLSGEVMRGMKEKALRGGYQSAMPLGYRMNRETKIPEIYEPEAVIVRKIYDEYSGNGKSYLEIARELNTLGYKTRRGANYEERTVKYILQNPFYTGMVRWNRQNHAEHTIKDESEWIISRGQHEAIISREAFDLVQEQIVKRSRPYKAHSTGSIKHWLSGMVKCSSCGSSLNGSVLSAGGKVTSFQCGNYSRGSCMTSHFIKAEKLEQAVYAAFEQVIKTNEFSYEVRTPQNEADDSLLLNRQLEKLDDKEKRIKQAYRDGIDTLEEYKENKQLLADERQRIEEQLSALTDSEPERKEQLARNIRSIYDIIRDETLDKRTRANALRSVVNVMVYDKAEDTLSVEFYI